MIMINNQWEQINDIDDVKRIIEENLSKELADKIDELIEQKKFELCSNYKICDECKEMEQIDKIKEILR